MFSAFSSRGLYWPLFILLQETEKMPTLQIFELYNTHYLYICLTYPMLFASANVLYMYMLCICPARSDYAGHYYTRVCL